MREILFKAKRIDNGEWVEGWILKDEVTGQYFIHASGNSVNESDKVNEEGCLRFVAFEVDKNTLCQYTGLTDNNGNKIWENDVVIGREGYCGNPKIPTREIKFSVKYSGGCYRHLYISDFYEFERIGNIFDNSELLEGGAE